MEKSSFFDAEKLADGSFDRVYSSEDIAEYFSSFVGNGVYANPATSLQVVAHSTSNMIMVKAGKAWINGYFYQLTEDLELPITTGNPSQPRVDTVVVRWDFLKRNIELVVVAGTPSNAPQPKAPVRTSTKYELVLANILVKPGAMVITNAEITDKRFDNEVCGIVTGAVEQIDTSGLFAQYDKEFKAWFENVQTTLDGDVAANLAVQISNKLDKSELPLSVVNGGTGNRDGVAPAVKDAVDGSRINIVGSEKQLSSNIQDMAIWNNNLLGKASFADVWDKVRQKPVKLWSGEWDKGSINVPGTDNYNLFIVQRGEVSLLTHRRVPHPSTSSDVHPGDMYGVSANIYEDTGTVYTTAFFCRTNGDVWSGKRMKGIRISPTHNISASERVTSIWGLM